MDVLVLDLRMPGERPDVSNDRPSVHLPDGAAHCAIGDNDIGGCQPEQLCGAEEPSPDELLSASDACSRAWQSIDAHADAGVQPRASARDGDTRGGQNATPREIEIVRMIAQGPHKIIAERLYDFRGHGEDPSPQHLRAAWTVASSWSSCPEQRPV